MQARPVLGHIKQDIVIADDIMIVGKKPNYENHDQALTTLLETVRRCNVQLNYEKLQYKQYEVDFFSETYTTSSCKPDKDKVTAKHQDVCANREEAITMLYWNDQLLVQVFS